jgi:hypothetical protein
MGLTRRTVVGVILKRKMAPESFKNQNFSPPTKKHIPRSYNYNGLCLGLVLKLKLRLRLSSQSEE